MRLWVLRDRRKCCGKRSRLYCVNVASRPPCATLMQHPLRYRLPPPGRATSTVTFLPRSASNAIFFAFSATHWSWKENGREIASWPVNPFRRRTSFPSGVLTTSLRPSCVWATQHLPNGDGREAFANTVRGRIGPPLHRLRSKARSPAPPAL